MRLLRLPRWKKICLLSCLAVLTITGIAWLLLHQGRGADELPSLAEPWLMRLHGLASFGALLGLGAIVGGHVVAGWRITRRHRWTNQRMSGILLGTLFGLTVLTAYMLYYFAPESVRELIGWIHAVLGALIAVAWWIHQRPRH